MKPEQWEAGKTLQTAREHRGMSIRAAARAANVSEGWIRQIEHGWRLRTGVWERAEPSPAKLVGLSAALGLDPLAVLEEAGVTISATDRERETARALLAKVPDSQLDTLIGFIRGLIAAGP